MVEFRGFQVRALQIRRHKAGVGERRPRQIGGVEFSAGQVRAANRGQVLNGDDVRRVMNAGQVQIEAVKGLYFRAVEATVQRAVLPLYQEAGLPLPQGEAGKEQASHGRYTTDWLREAPYSLAELAAFVPTGWRRPLVQPQTMYGRNDALFRAGMKNGAERRAIGAIGRASGSRCGFGTR